jgi:hypothetical protein
MLSVNVRSFIMQNLVVLGIFVLSVLMPFAGNLFINSKTQTIEGVVVAISLHRYFGSKTSIYIFSRWLWTKRSMKWYCDDHTTPSPPVVWIQYNVTQHNNSSLQCCMPLCWLSFMLPILLSVNNPNVILLCVTAFAKPTNSRLRVLNLYGLC